MDKLANAKPKELTLNRRVVVRVFIVLALAATLLLIAQLNSLKRSVAAYCAVYREEDAKLADAQGNTYGVSVFSHKSSDPVDFAEAFSKLERVSPDDIRPAVKTLQQLFKELSNDSSQALSASLSGIPAETTVKNWTDSHCQ